MSYISYIALDYIEYKNTQKTPNKLIGIEEISKTWKYRNRFSTPKNRDGQNNVKIRHVSPIALWTVGLTDGVMDRQKEL